MFQSWSWENQQRAAIACVPQHDITMTSPHYSLQGLVGMKPVTNSIALLFRTPFLCSFRLYNCNDRHEYFQKHFKRSKKYACILLLHSSACGKRTKIRGDWKKGLQLLRSSELSQRLSWTQNTASLTSLQVTYSWYSGCLGGKTAVMIPRMQQDKGCFALWWKHLSPTCRG